MGPPPNNSRQAIHKSLLRGTSKSAPFQKRILVKLCPEAGMSALEYCRELLGRAGFRDLQELHKLDGLPFGRLVCREVEGDIAPAGDPLFHAAILGLCNTAFYSFDRPVVWTETRLRRQVELFSVEGFYED